MDCAGCYDSFAREEMHLCETCRMYRCLDCFTSHFVCRGPRHKDVQKKKVSRIKRKSKHYKGGTDYCDSCHRQFVKMDLNYGPDPFVREVYGENRSCVLCDECYNSSCDDI